MKDVLRIELCMSVRLSELEEIMCSFLREYQTHCERNDRIIFHSLESVALNIMDHEHGECVN